MAFYLPRKICTTLTMMKTLCTVLCLISDFSLYKYLLRNIYSRKKDSFMHIPLSIFESCSLLRFCKALKKLNFHRVCYILFSHLALNYCPDKLFYFRNCSSFFILFSFRPFSLCGHNRMKESRVKLHDIIIFAGSSVVC